MKFWISLQLNMCSIGAHWGAYENEMQASVCWEVIQLDALAFPAAWVAATVGEPLARHGSHGSNGYATGTTWLLGWS